jgi:large subunit ribosomal protein L5
MKQLKLDKVTLHCGTADQAKLTKGLKLLEIISSRKAVKTCSRKRIPAFAIRPGLPIGCKVTVRGKAGIELLRRMMEGIGNNIKRKQFNKDSFSFGIKEYIQVPSIPYQRDVGIMGFEVTVTLKRPGYNVKNRKIKGGKIPKRHIITTDETVEFAKNKLNIEII